MKAHPPKTGPIESNDRGYLRYWERGDFERSAIEMGSGNVRLSRESFQPGRKRKRR